MTLEILKKYLDVCENLKIKPSLKGANKFRKNLESVDRLLRGNNRFMLIQIVS